MAKEKKKSEEEEIKPSDTQSASDSSADKQLPKEDVKKESADADGLQLPLVSLDGEIEQALAEVKSLAASIRAKETENAQLKEKLNPPVLHTRYANADDSPSAEDKKMYRYIIKANTGYIVLAKDALAKKRKNYDNLINKSSADLRRKMESDKASSTYFIAKNKPHIRSKIFVFLQNLQRRDGRYFSQLKSLSIRTGSKQRQDFEQQFLSTLKESDPKLHKQFTGTVSFKNEMLAFVREQIQNL